MLGTPFLLSVREVARQLGVHEQTVRGFIHSGKLPCVWVGRAVRLRPEDVERLIDDPRVTRCRVCERPNLWSAQACSTCGADMTALEHQR
jgi:excisionase family DNA binding protein